MKLYIKQKVFSWKDKFTVADENGAPQYYVQGEMFSLGKKLHITDLNGTEVAIVQQKLMSFKPKFYVIMNGEQVAEIVKEITLFKQKYTIAGPGWEVEGNVHAHDYTVIDNGAAIASVHKKWVSWGDSYEMDIADNVNRPFALSVVLAIDCVMDAAANAAGN